MFQISSVLCICANVRKTLSIRMQRIANLAVYSLFVYTVFMFRHKAVMKISFIHYHSIIVWLEKAILSFQEKICIPGSVTGCPYATVAIFYYGVGVSKLFSRPHLLLQDILVYNS